MIYDIYADLYTANLLLYTYIRTFYLYIKKKTVKKQNEMDFGGVKKWFLLYYTSEAKTQKKNTRKKKSIKSEIVLKVRQKIKFPQILHKIYNNVECVRSIKQAHRNGKQFELSI